MFDYTNDPFAEGARQYQRKLVEQTLSKYLANCIRNNHRCARCCFNHNGSCFFAKECFENDQKYYKEEND